VRFEACGDLASGSLRPALRRVKQRKAAMSARQAV
jgi:hypothetical protein